MTGEALKKTRGGLLVVCREGFTYPSTRRGSRRSDGAPPIRENLSRRADEVAGLAW